MRPRRACSAPVHPLLRLFVLCLVPFSGALVAGPVEQVQGLANASLLVMDRGRPAISHNPDAPRVPASTMKVLTALAALDTWGRDYRFTTDFYTDASGWLWVRGMADPYLVSEELDVIAQALRGEGIASVAGIGLDDTVFDRDVEIAGRSASDNPYDAPVTALAANFNTVNVVKSGNGVRSAEPQTPLTATARRFGSQGPAGKKRVNLKERGIAVRYFGELLAAKLEAAGVRVGDGQRNGAVPAGARRVYTHRNGRPLEAMVAPMLDYSNNFVANALFLRMASPDGRGRVSMAGAQAAMTRFASRRFGWRDFRIDDGAGLSRANRLSARQLVELMEAFVPYRDLMPTQDDDPGVKAKTGTLRGVSTYAGYVRRSGRWEPFALLVNQPVDYGLRLRLASALAR